MIIVKLQGGLGNQMFQFALGQILGKKNKAPVLLDKSFFELKKVRPGHTPRQYELNIFNIDNPEPTASEIRPFFKPSLTNKIRKSLGLKYPKIYFEPSFDFQPQILQLEAPVFLQGYFQSYKYYKGNETFVKDIFTFPVDRLDERNTKILKQIRNSITISIHARRGDYVNDKITRDFHGNCDVDYYLKAIKEIDPGKNNFTLVFFSDDSTWIKEKFSDLSYYKIFIDHNKDGDSWKDMFLMSCCNHNIIANSSFSWWAAWLNESPGKKVVAPRRWFAEKETEDLIPTEWIKI